MEFLLGSTLNILPLLLHHCSALPRRIQNTKVAPYTQEAMDAFNLLKDKLISEPVMASGRADCHYALIKDAATGTADLAGEFGAIITKWTSTIIPLPFSLHPDS
jgi:hypothetical protein